MSEGMVRVIFVCLQALRFMEILGGREGGMLDVQGGRPLFRGAESPVCVGNPPPPPLSVSLGILGDCERLTARGQGGGGGFRNRGEVVCVDAALPDLKQGVVVVGVCILLVFGLVLLSRCGRPRLQMRVRGGYYPSGQDIAHVL